MLKIYTYLFLGLAILLVSCSTDKPIASDDHATPINGKKIKARKPPPSNYHGKSSSSSPF